MYVKSNRTFVYGHFTWPGKKHGGAEGPEASERLAGPGLECLERAAWAGRHRNRNTSRVFRQRIRGEVVSQGIFRRLDTHGPKQRGILQVV